MSDEQPRSIRRAAIIGDRREVLVTMNGRNFTIKDARDVLSKYSDFTDNRGEERKFYTARSWIIHFIWRKHFPDYIYLEATRFGLLRHQAKHTQKSQTTTLLAAEQDNVALKRFVNASVEALVTNGFINPKPYHNTDKDLLYWMRDDGNLLATTAWYAGLSKEKADTLIQGLLNRAITVAQNPDDYLVYVTFLGVFGGYTDEKVTTINDVDILYDHDRIQQYDDLTRDEAWEEWKERAEELWQRDNRNRVTGRWGEEHDWPSKKLDQFLRSRNPRLRLIKSVSKSIRIKVLYLHPYGILEQPFFVDLPKGTHGPEWDAFRSRVRIEA